MEKVKDPTIREIIVGCIHEAKENRYDGEWYVVIAANWSIPCSFTVKTLLAHPFFLPELEGIEIKAATSNTSGDDVQLTFQVAKKVNKGQPHDTYERLFNLQSDQAQSIAQEMVKLVLVEHLIHCEYLSGQTECNSGNRSGCNDKVNPE